VSDLLDRIALRPRLSVKLATFGAALTAAVVGATLIVVTLEIKSSTRHRLELESARNRQTFAHLQEQKLANLTFAASLISNTASLPFVLDTYRAEALNGTRRDDLALTVERELEKLLSESRKDIILVTNDSGKVFASVARNGTAVPRGENLSRMTAVAKALDIREGTNKSNLGLLERPDVNYQVAVYPVQLGGYTLGTVVVGERLDSGFVAAARTAFAGSVVVTPAGKVISGNLPGSNQEDVASRLANYRGGESPTLQKMGSEEFVVAPLSLGDTQNGEPVRLWLIQPISSVASAISRPLIRNILLYGLLAVVLAGLGAAFLARSVLSPLDRFVNYLREGSTKQVSTRFDSRDAPAEVQALNESFGQLMDSLHTSEAQLRQAQKLEAVGTLAGGIAHDFNNLLTVIGGFTQLAMTDIPEDSPAAENLTQVLSASERATRLTKQLLAFSRKQVLKPSVIDLGAVIDDLAPMLRRLIGEHIKLGIDRQPEAARVLADRSQLEQVIINLVVNARDAMPRGGTLTIRVRRTPEGIVFVTKDDGMGIPEHVRERIFEPFFTTKEQGKGTGLGLATVYGIVQQSGGRIDVESDVGVGTTFTIVLPEAPAAPVSSAVAAGADGHLRGHERVLLVEDEPSVRILAKRALEDYGYQVTAAMDPADALKIAADSQFDALLTDVVMPVMGGPELAKKVLELQPNLAVIYMSGYADDALKSFDLGGDVAFLSKPFAPPDLAQMVKETLRERMRNTGEARA
jgi:signal transduction histidine kinase/ActR/RegA family two-component response regulator